MKNLLLPFVFLFTLIACNQQKNSIYAEIEGLGNDTVYVQYIVLDEANKERGSQDTIIAADNKFVYDIPADKAYLVILEPAKMIKWGARSGYKGYEKYKVNSESGIIFLVVDSGEKVRIKGKIDGDYLEYNAKGTDFNESYSVQRHAEKTYTLKEDSLNNIVDYYTMSPKAPAGQDSLIHALMDIRKGKREEIMNNRLEYVKNNPDKDLSAHYLMRMPWDTIGFYYDKLDSKVKEGIFKNLLDKCHTEYVAYKRVRENKEKIKEGAPAPDFTLKNLNGENISLSDMKGKYLVLDFWGSWCGWCIAGYPDMKKYYDKYKDKVEFIGIACKDTEKDWKKAVADNKLDWTQLINDESGDMDKNVSALYAISGYPTKIILNKNLKIVSVIVGESPDFYNKLDELME